MSDTNFANDASYMHETEWSIVVSDGNRAKVVSCSSDVNRGSYSGVIECCLSAKS